MMPGQAGPDPSGEASVSPDESSVPPDEDSVSEAVTRSNATPAGAGGSSRRLLGAAAVIALGNVLSRGLGLVRDQVIGDVGAAQEDDTVRREPVVTTPRRKPEEPRRHDEVDASNPNRTRPPVEPVETGLRPDDACVGRAAQETTGSRTSTAERSCVCVYWKL